MFVSECFKMLIWKNKIQNSNSEGKLLILKTEAPIFQPDLGSTNFINGSPYSLILHGKHPIFFRSYQHYGTSYQDVHIKGKGHQYSHQRPKIIHFKAFAEGLFYKNLYDPNMISNTTNISVNAYSYLYTVKQNYDFYLF